MGTACGGLFPREHHKELRESPAILPWPCPETRNQLTWLGYSEMNRKTEKGLDCCTHSPVLFYYAVLKPSPFLYSQLHGQRDLISSSTPLMRRQRKLIKRRSPTGHTLDCNTSTEVWRFTRSHQKQVRCSSQRRPFLLQTSTDHGECVYAVLSLKQQLLATLTWGTSRQQQQMIALRIFSARAQDGSGTDVRDQSLQRIRKALGGSLCSLWAHS